jgi:hypothetical protein
MGYNTKFKGSLKLSKTLTKEQQKWFNDWTTIRKKHYDSNKLMEHYKGVGSLDGDYGENGEFFGYIPNELRDGDNVWKSDYSQWVNGSSDLMFPIEGKNNDSPSNQPSLWNNWMIVGDELFYNDGDKFYGYIEWLEYIRTKILSKWGITFEDGYKIKWRGEDKGDRGSIVYENGELIDNNFSDSEILEFELEISQNNSDIDDLETIIENGCDTDEDKEDVLMDIETLREDNEYLWEQLNELLNN